MSCAHILARSNWGLIPMTGLLKLCPLRIIKAMTRALGVVGVAAAVYVAAAAFVGHP